MTSHKPTPNHSCLRMVTLSSLWSADFTAPRSLGHLVLYSWSCGLPETSTGMLHKSGIHGSSQFVSSLVCEALWSFAWAALVSTRRPSKSPSPRGSLDAACHCILPGCVQVFLRLCAVYKCTFRTFECHPLRPRASVLAWMMCSFQFLT